MAADLINKCVLYISYKRMLINGGEIRAKKATYE